MIKKVVIAVAAVLVGFSVLAWVSPPLFEALCNQWQKGVKSAEDAVPLEQRIEILHGKLADLNKNKVKYFDAVAKEAVDVDRLAAEVDDMSGKLAVQWQRIEKFRGDLETKKASLTYGGREVSRDAVADQLAHDFESYKTAEKALSVKKELLAARKKSLDAAKDQLGTLEQRRDEMANRLAKMETDLKLVRMKESESSLKLDDNDFSRLNSEMDEVNGRISEKQKSLELQAQFANGPIDPLAEKPAEAKDILKQIDDFKSARKGEAKTSVAEEK